jgi:drug/metabolite transporter (DMT)-like permease
MVRMIGGALVFQAFAASTGGRVKIAPRDHLRLAGVSLLGVVLNQVLFLAGLKITSAVSATLLCAAIPVFTATLAVVFRKEAASLRTGGGLALALSGMLWLTFSGGKVAGLGGLLQAMDRGAVLVALNSLAYAAYLVFARDLIRRLGAVTVVAWVFTWGALLFAPVGVPALWLDAGGWSLRAWALVAFVVLVPTVFAYVANAWALGRVNASLVTIYIYLQPVLAALLAWVQLGQGLRREMAGGAVLILVGVGVVAFRAAKGAGRAARAPSRGG